MNTTSSSLPSSPLAAPAASRSRRSFLRCLTIGAAAAVVEGCGGGGGTGSTVSATPAPVAPAAPAPVPTTPVVVAPAPVPAPAAPVFLSIPTIAFTQGTPSSFSVADYISAANFAALTLVLNESPLPAGVTFNAANRSFDYDGKGVPAGTEGHALTAIGA